MQAKSIACVDTEYSADCIEWCPSPGYEDIFICGTYQVIEPQTGTGDTSQSSDRPNDNIVTDEEEAEQSPAPAATQRTGRLLVFQVDPDDRLSVREVQRLETNAILDAKWFPSPLNSSPQLAVADAKGQIMVYALRPTKQLELIQAVQVGHPSVLVLSLDISPLVESKDPPIAYSLSDGTLGILSARDGEWKVEETWHGHDFEPWCIAWDRWDRHIVWSGGDDLKLKRWDLRDTSTPTSTISRFEAGITTLTSSPHTPHLLAVGSYDSHLRIYDSRSPRQELQELDVGGGVWRAKFHPDPTRADEMLLATMHDGFKVVKLNLDHRIRFEEDASKAQWTVGTREIVRRFDEHKSLAYGADWSRLPPSDYDTLVATCSFYDHTMHLWRG